MKLSDKAFEIKFGKYGIHGVIDTYTTDRCYALYINLFDLDASGHISNVYGGCPIQREAIKELIKDLHAMWKQLGEMHI